MVQQVRSAFPREALKLVQLDGYVRKYGHPVPQKRFTGAPWSLEASEADDLMAKMKRVGIPLSEFAKVKPYYGIKTGLNEAFLIDTPTKERLIREDPRSAEIIKPYLRGQDIRRCSFQLGHRACRRLACHYTLCREHPPPRRPLLYANAELLVSL